MPEETNKKPDAVNVPAESASEKGKLPQTAADNDQLSGSRSIRAKLAEANKNFSMGDHSQGQGNKFQIVDDSKADKQANASIANDTKAPIPNEGPGQDKTQTVQTPDERGFVDLSGATPDNISARRDEIAKGQEKALGQPDSSNVLIESTDSDPPIYRVRVEQDDHLSGTDKQASHNPFQSPTQREAQMSSDVSAVFGQSGTTTRLTYAEQLTLLGDAKEFLRLNTNISPLAVSGDRNPLFSQTRTQTQEKSLIDALNKELAAKPDTIITMKHLAELALKISDNDTTLALLTLANFSKNVACIERRQSQEYINDHALPGLKEAYNKSAIDNIFKHIEGFSDSNNTAYNKEGAFYHFWNAAYASHIMGPTLATTAVGMEMFMNGHQPIEYGSGLAGAQSGRSIPQMPIVRPAAPLTSGFGMGEVVAETENLPVEAAKYISAMFSKQEPG